MKIHQLTRSSSSNNVVLFDFLQQVINAVSIAPVQTVQVQATPIVSMSGQTQIIASSSCTPLAIAATSQGQQLAQLTQQGMSTLSTSSQPMNASQILGTSQITLTPTLATGC